jgi:hypothetical protein
MRWMRLLCAGWWWCFLTCGLLSRFANRKGGLMICQQKLSEVYRLGEKKPLARLGWVWVTAQVALSKKAKSAPEGR